MLAQSMASRLALEWPAKEGAFLSASLLKFGVVIRATKVDIVKLWLSIGASAEGSPAWPIDWVENGLHAKLGSNACDCYSQ